MKKRFIVPVIFVVIGLALAVVGFVTGDYFWYIRTGIFVWEVGKFLIYL